MLAVVNDPQRQSLNALLRVAELGQLLLQGGFGKGRHDPESQIHRKRLERLLALLGFLFSKVNASRSQRAA